MINWLYKNKIEIFFLFVAGIFVNAECYWQARGFCITFFDPDDYMRLVRIKDFFNNGDLSNTIISRCNVPFGCDLHWTLFYDLFILIPAYVLNFFLNSIDKSIEYVGFFISPIIKSVTVMFFLYTSQKLMTKKDAFLAATIFDVHTLILPFGIFGRPDHHAFIMLFIVIYFYSIIKIIESKFANKNAYINASIIAILCIWISPETLIPLLLIDGILFVYSFFDIDGLRKLSLKNTIIATGICIITSFPVCSVFKISICGILLLYAMIKHLLENSEIKYWPIALFLVIIISLHSIFQTEYDRVSSVHSALYLCSVICFEANIINKRLDLKYRILDSFCWFVIVATVFLLIYPKFFYGMSANISDYVKEIWLYKVAEMQSPLKHGDIAFFITYCAISAVSVINKIIELTDKKFVATDLIWWILIVNAVCYTLFTAFSYRMLPYSVLFVLLPIVDFGMNSSLTKSLYRPYKIIVTSFISVFFLFFTTYFKNSEDTTLPKSSYTQKELFQVIDNLSSIPVVIMANSNDGPSILYYTKHSVVGAPYHRQVQGIISSYKVMEEKYNEGSVKNILKLTNSLYILIRKSKYKTNKTSNFAKMVINNHIPQWCSPVILPDKFNDIIVLKIKYNLL